MRQTWDEDIEAFERGETVVSEVGESENESHIAVKIACRSGDDVLKARFAHEAEMLVKVLSSDGPFPAFYGHGEHEGCPYLVMELLEPFDVPGESNAFGDFFLEVLDAVEALHQRGYIHQDLKPTNMMRRRSDGRLVLIDFGQAHKIEEGRLPLRMDSLTLDSSGHRMATGTAGYCAPEQLDAERTAFPPATDVYALGMMVRNFCGRRSEWRTIGSDATDPDLRRRIPDIATLRRLVRSKAFRNRRNATHDLLHDIEVRRSRRMGDMHVSWERLVSITLSKRRRTAGVGRPWEDPVLTMEELGGRLPGMGIGAREFGPVRIGLITGLRCIVDEKIHFTDSAVVRVYGSGVLDMDVSAEGEVVFVISGECTVINRSTRQTGIDYFVNNGALLCFPQIPEEESRELDRKVLVVKGSDILSKWVGGSEQNIAAAFRTAESERAILFFDEIDGLVQSREKATASWQVSQVNELLQQMENFDGVMIAATNFCKNLDPAIMRRFTFKLEFDYLDDEGKRTFFERMFRTTLSEDELAELNALRNLAPGDFRTVRQEQFYLAGAVTNLDRIAALKEECALKKDGDQSSRIGFAA